MVNESWFRAVQFAVAQAEDIHRQVAPVVKELQRNRPLIEEVRRQAAFAESSRQWLQAFAVVQSELPKRGWYLTGEESHRFTKAVAQCVEAKDWRGLDEAIVAYAEWVQVDVSAFCSRLSGMGVPSYCVNRARRFLEARAAHDHEAATALGIPLIDELCRALFGGRDFTTKRNK